MAIQRGEELTMEIPTLESEIEGIQDEAIKALTKAVLLKVPDYNWTLPSSSTGKYHPMRDRAAYGNTYHTKDVVKFALVIADSKGYYIGAEKEGDRLMVDKVRCAAILHDCAKYGLAKYHTQYTLNDHPAIAADLIEVVRQNFPLGLDGIDIAQAVRRHTGRWGNPKPETELDWIIHLADNIASHNY
jgi:HD domain